MGCDRAPAARGGPLLLLHGSRQARYLALQTRDLRLPGLPPRMDGRRILHVSDVHLAPPFELAGRITSLAGAAGPDWIFVTGDLIRGGAVPREAPRFLAELGAIAPTWFVSGNADYPKDKAPDFEAGAFAPARCLANRAEPLANGDPPCWIVGVSDPFSGRDRLARAFEGVPKHAWVILLAHSPDIILKPLSRRARIIYSGHTHGGQVCLPRIGALYTRTRVSRRYASGVHDLGGTTLIVSRGAGTTRLPIRIFCPAELTLWRLAAEPSPGGVPGILR